MLIESDLVLALPTLVDLGRLEGVARALVQLIDDILDLSRRWQGPEVLRKRYRVAVQGEVVSMTIGMACEAPVARSQERQERVPAALQTRWTPWTKPLHLVKPAGRLDGLKRWRSEGDT